MSGVAYLRVEEATKTASLNQRACDTVCGQLVRPQAISLIIPRITRLKLFEMESAIRGYASFLRATGRPRLARRSADA